MAQDMEQLYRRHYQTVYRYALRLTGSEHAAEELAAETFYRAMVALPDFRGECAASTWLCQIARNQYLSLCRERKHRGELEQEPGDDGLECGFADRDAAKRLHRLLHDLPEPYKEVFSLRVFGELSFSRIGQLFGKSDSWARLIFYRAKTELRRQADENDL